LVSKETVWWVFVCVAVRCISREAAVLCVHAIFSSSMTASISLVTHGYVYKEIVKDWLATQVR